MSGWGSGHGWGSGDPWGSPSEFAATMLSRLLMFVRHGPRFRGLVNALATRTGDLLAAQESVLAAFDVDTAVGAQLDRIGGIMQLPRLGYGDTRYRSLLKVQIDILLSSTGASETLLRVFEAITGAPADEYEEHYPAQFVIGGYVDPADATLLADFLRRAKGWGVYGGLSIHPADESDLDGGTLLVDVEGEEGMWSAVIEGRTFAARMTSTGADDIETENAGTLDGTTHVPAFEARNFDGATNRIDFVSPLSLTMPQPFTASAWVRLETLAGLRVIFVAASATGPAQSMILRSNGDALEFSHAYSAGTSMRRVSATGVLTVGTWHYVTVIYPGNDTAANTTLCVDGIEVASYSLTTDGSGTPRTAEGTWSIGGRVEADGNNTDGDIASVDVWPRELALTEVWHAYEEALEGGAFAGPPDDAPSIDNPGVVDLDESDSAGDLAYATEVTVTI